MNNPFLFTALILILSSCAQKETSLNLKRTSETKISPSTQNQLVLVTRKDETKVRAASIMEIYQNKRFNLVFEDGVFGKLKRHDLLGGRLMKCTLTSNKHHYSGPCYRLKGSDGEYIYYRPDGGIFLGETRVIGLALTEGTTGRIRSLREDGVLLSWRKISQSDADAACWIESNLQFCSYDVLTAIGFKSDLSIPEE